MGLQEDRLKLLLVRGHVRPSCRICVYGDIGELVLYQPSSTDAINWARSLGAGGYDYALRKASPWGSVREFSDKEARLFLSYLSVDSPDLAQKINDAWDGSTQHSYIAAQYENWNEIGEIDLGEVYTTSSLTCFSALLWLCERLNPPLYPIPSAP